MENKKYEAREKVGKQVSRDGPKQKPASGNQAGRRVEKLRAYGKKTTAVNQNKTKAQTKKTSIKKKKVQYYKVSRGAIIQKAEFGSADIRKAGLNNLSNTAFKSSAKHKKMGFYRKGEDRKEQNTGDYTSVDQLHQTEGQAGEVRRKITKALWNAASKETHKLIGDAEKDNLGVEAAHKMELAAEKGYGLYKKYHYDRNIGITEGSTDGHSKYNFRRESNARFKKNKNGQNTSRKSAVQTIGASNQASQVNYLLSIANTKKIDLQKQRYKRMYQEAKHASMMGTIVKTEAVTQQIFRQQTFMAIVKTVAKVIAAKAKTAAVIVVAVILLLVGIGTVVENALTIMSGILSQQISTVTAQTTYVSSDEDIYAAENYYTGLESDLEGDIQSIETTYPGYDEYIYNISAIGHNPYHLTSYLTAIYGDYIFNNTIEAALDTVFALQYAIETEPKSETRTKTETVINPETGLESTVTVEYEYKILYVTVKNAGFSNVIASIADTNLLNAYTMFNYTYGNRDYLWDTEYVFEDSYETFEPPEEALDDEQFARMLDLIEQCLGTPYVWGGSSLSGFDCSGFVSYVLNNAGVSDAGRLTANGWYSAASPIAYNDLQPGDLIFFQGTYNTSGASHIGIYVGDGMMAHAGDPVQYTSINASYWQSHLLGYGRIN